MQDKSTTSRLLRVFLCHSSGDKHAVRDLHRHLRQDGFAPWLDEEDLMPGQNWQQTIAITVRECDVVVVCLSRASITKEGYVQKEIKIALDVEEEKPEGTIFIIPARLEPGVEPPERLRRWQWVDLFQEGGYERLKIGLNMRSASLGLKGFPSYRDAVTTFAEQYFEDVLARAKGNRVKAAELANVDRTILYKYLKKRRNLEE